LGQAGPNRVIEDIQLRVATHRWVSLQTNCICCSGDARTDQIRAAYRLSGP